MTKCLTLPSDLHLYGERMFCHVMMFIHKIYLMYIKIGSININKFYRILMKMCRKGARTIECVKCFHK